MNLGRGGGTRTPGPMVPNHVRYQTALHLEKNMAEKEGFEPSRPLTRPTPLAGEPLQPLEYFSIFSWRRGWDSNPRPITESLIFKTSSLNRSDTSPRIYILYGGIAQLARAFGSYPKGHRFESCCRYHVGAFSSVG